MARCQLPDFSVHLHEINIQNRTIENSVVINKFRFYNI